MGLKPRKSPAEGEFLFELDEQPLEETITALGGVPLFVRAVRSLDVPGSVKRNLHLKQRERGYDEPTYVESFLVLNAVGGDCVEDLERLQEDPGVAEMLGYAVPSPAAALKFLYKFHDEDAIEKAQQELPTGQVSYIPAENEPLRGLAQVNTDVVKELGRRCPDQKIATVDLDATVIESWKREAKATYEGGTGYQPMLALWAEMNVVLADQFRDGNVPAIQDPLSAARRAFAALPETVQERYFRGDAACYESELLSWLRNEQREGGPSGRIGFAVSVPMMKPLKEEILALRPDAWQPYREECGVERQCANVPYYPEEKPENQYREPLRYVAIRVRRRQGELFGDGSEAKYFAVATNLWDWAPKKLLLWHREKAGSIEALHDVLKNELAGGVMPCSRFGANAAWLRLAVLTHNIFTALKRLALPAELLSARPKRLRFLILNTPGKLIHHARQTLLRLTQTANRFRAWRRAFRVLPIPV
jgi:Transposase DDE domain group 1